MRERESSCLEGHLLEEQLDQSPPSSTTTANNPLPRKQLSLLPLIFLIYFEVAGGPYGEEPSVRAAGPLFAILGFLIFPFIWSVPEALITAELATAFPGNGGYVIWAHEAFGPFWASLMGSWKFLSGVINLASYPVLCIDYIKLVFPIFSSGFFHYFAILVSTLGLSFLNYSGLAIVGFSAVVLGVMSILPFVILTLFAIPKIDPRRWVSLGQVGVTKDWRLFFNTLFWNLNFWDNVSTLAGEVEKPQSTYPKALLSAGLFACLAYLIPLLAATGAIPLVQENWVDGYFADVAQIIVGKWLKIFVEIGACLSIIGLYEVQLSNCAYQILGMTELGILPKSFEQRSKFFGTPWVGILISTLIALVVCYMNFEDIISTVNFLYSLGMLLEFASFLWLRRKFPKIKRPFKVPMEMGGLVILCLIPSGFLVYVIIVAHMKVYLISGALTIFGICWYLLMNLCKAKMWFQFNKIVARENLNDELIY